MSPLGTVHLVFSLVAVLTGGIVVLRPKGTRWHRTIGHLYATSMVGIVVTSLFLFTLTGRFGPFHVAAVVAGLTLMAGMGTVLFRRPKKKWIEHHASWMSWSYIGLMAAFVAESATRFIMPAMGTYLAANSLMGAFWGIVSVATFLVVGLGVWATKTRLEAAIAKTPEAIRREREALRA
ncbi:MAG: DUF2306 domain-containing protein [Longimicrobiales bacterium]